MKFFLLMLLLSINVFATKGDIISGFIDSTGFRIVLEIEDIDTGGDFNFRFGGNNETDSATGMLTIQSRGFNNSADTMTIERYAYVSDTMRLPFPNHTSIDWDMNGDNAIITFPITKCVYSADQVTISIQKGLYWNGSDTSLAVIDLAVTNNSEWEYSTNLPVGNWKCIDGGLIENDQLKLTCIGYHPFGIAAVRFTICDQHDNTLTYVVDSFKIDPLLNDTFPPEAAYHTFNVSGFYDGDSIICNIKIYPIVGDSNAVLSSDNTVLRNWWLRDQVYHINRSGTLVKKVYVFVDSVTGDDGNCIASNDSATAATFPCLTCSRALYLGRQYNNDTNGVGNASNVNIYLKKGTYESMGGNQSVGNTGIRRGWSWFRPIDGVSRDEIVFTPDDDGSSYRQLWDRRCKFSNITFDLSSIGNSYVIYGLGNNQYLWIDSCVVKGDSSSIFNFQSNWAFGFEHVLITNSILSGHYYMLGDLNINSRFYGIGSGKYSANLNVGNYISQRSDLLAPLFGESTDSTKTLDNIIFANNIIHNAQSDIFSFYRGPKTNFAIVNNIVEFSKQSSSVIATIISDPKTMYSLYLFHNTFTGQRCILGYTQQSEVNYNPHSYIGNIFNHWATKTDIFHGDPVGADGWLIDFGVNCHGNINCSASYPPEFGGEYYSFLGHYDIGYIGDSSMTGSKNGFGNYMLFDTSAARNFTIKSPVKYDIFGTSRGDTTDAGAIDCDTVPDEYVPKIISVNPNPWYAGKQIDIYGINFGNNGFVVLHGDTLGNAELSTETHIIDTIPISIIRGNKAISVVNDSGNIGVSDDSLNVFVPYKKMALTLHWANFTQSTVRIWYKTTGDWIVIDNSADNLNGVFPENGEGYYDWIIPPELSGETITLRVVDATEDDKYIDFGPYYIE